MISEKRPRDYALDILKLTGKKEMQNYLTDSVPVQYQEWVKKYVRMWWPMRQSLVNKHKKAA